MHHLLDNIANVMQTARKAHKLMVAITALVLSACVSPTPYQAANDQRYGYTDEQLEDNRYKVSFAGNTLTEQQTVADYMLYRAAELTKAAGYDYFVITNRLTEYEQLVIQRPLYDPFFTPLSHHRRRAYGWLYDTGPYFYSARHPFFMTGYYDVPAGTRYTSWAEIVLVKGAKPQGKENAYTAETIIENLSPKIIRPEDLKDKK